ncbi:fructokinase [Abditibacteriota bacterium]|nr:fructokinase [Abditibacteriota bacterium]
MHDYLLGIDLGGTNLKIVAVTPDGETLERVTAPTNDDGAAGFRGAVRREVEGVRQKHGQPAFVGLSAPGLASRDARSITWMPGRLQGLELFDWSEFLGYETRICNDAQAAMAGEAWLGAARGCENAFLLTLGTGVGGAILLDGRVARGHIGRAGHLGHICLDIDGVPDIVNTPGSIEDLFGDHSVNARSKGRFASTRELVAAAQGGDEDAKAVWARSIRALACAIASLVNVLDPEKVVLGGGIALAGTALFEPLRRELDALEWRPGGHQIQIVATELDDFAGALGAAYLAYQGVKSNGETD